MRIFLLALLPLLLTAKPPKAGRGHVKTILEADLVYLQPKNSATSHCLARRESTASGSGSAGSGASGACQMTAKDLYHGKSWEPGLRAALAFLPHCRSTWELIYTGFLDWDHTKAATGSANLEFPFRGDNPTVDWLENDEIKGRIRTRFWSAEGNYHRHVTPQRVDLYSTGWLIGLRYIDLKENLRLTSFVETDSSDYKIDTSNHLGGVQLGGLFESNLSCHITWGIGLKLGALANYAKDTTLWLDNNNTDTLINASPSHCNFSFMGELSTYFNFYFLNRIYIRVAYEGLYIGNIAEATRQIQYTVDTSPGINTKAHFILHGAQLGLGFIF